MAHMAHMAPALEIKDLSRAMWFLLMEYNARMLLRHVVPFDAI